jgi:transcriptional repressor NrdR
MKCPYCQFQEDRVFDSRLVRDGEAIRRRRECMGCGRRYTTFEQIEERRLMVVKRDGRREPFARAKLLRGLQLACQKRPVPVEALESIVERIERSAQDRGEGEIPSTRIGEMVMEAVRLLDPVAYVRFASVYRDFQDLAQFHDLLELLRAETRPARPPRARRRQRSGGLPALS